MKRQYYIYIITNKRNGILYIGVTNNIERRLNEHKNGDINGFSKKYKLSQLVYLEEYTNINEALQREKRLKKWNRSWKIELIEKTNPTWKDLNKK